jgi:hypothetical protein
MTVHGVMQYSDYEKFQRRSIEKVGGTAEITVKTELLDEVGKARVAEKLASLAFELSSEGILS